jgi:excisionase family DNA binding protein
MDLLARLRTLADTLPQGASLTVTVETLREWLVDTERPDLGDLTVADVAKAVHRKPNTVRKWIQRGEIEAYRFNRRDYRITPAALTAYLDRQRHPTDPTCRSLPGRESRARLGAWRQMRRKS